MTPDNGALKILFEVDDVDDQNREFVTSEGLWAEPTSTPGRFVLDNVPFFVSGVAFGDEVEVEERGPQLWFTHLARSLGHSTVRVATGDSKALNELRETVITLGCTCERDEQHGLLAIDVPPEADYEPVRQHLQQGEARNRWQYAECTMRHKSMGRDPDTEQCVPDESSSWPFASPSDQGVYVTDDVSKEGLPVLMVGHDEEGNWSFSGGEDFDLDRTHLIHLGWVVNHDPSLRQLADLPAGWGAFREGAGEPWELFEMDEEDEDEAEED